MAEPISQRGPLPSLSYLDTEKIKRESCTYNSYGIQATNMSAPPLTSPSTTYSGPPPPYSYPSSAASSTIGGRDAASGPLPPQSYIPAPEPRQIYTDDKESQPPPRQSLPPLREALHGQPNISINSLLSSNTTTAPPERPSYVTQSPTTPATRSFLEAPVRAPIEMLSQHKAPSYGSSEPQDRLSRPTYSPKMMGRYGDLQSPSANSHPSMRLPRTMTSPTLHSRPGAGVLQNNHQALSPVYNPTPATGSTATLGSSYSYKPQHPAYSYPSTAPSISSYTAPPIQQRSWQNNSADTDRAEEIRRATAKTSPPQRAAYGESVKRHLDIFDIETSLNEIAEGSGHALDFARTFGTRAHQTQRSGPIPGSLPTMNECDDMMRQQQRVLDSMARIRDVIYRQQQALDEQRIYDAQNLKAPPSEVDEDTHNFMDKLDGAGGFAGADAKKRRGRAAPPGRCHSCNRAETPEWRRGPDGARTLCNACGLHYAKLQRKMDSKDSGAGPSKLRPKESTTSSP